MEVLFPEGANGSQGKEPSWQSAHLESFLLLVTSGVLEEKRSTRDTYTPSLGFLLASVAVILEGAADKNPGEQKNAAPSGDFVEDGPQSLESCG